jgi:hypothetical protein
MLAGHAVERDAAGRLMPWTSWNSALDREMDFYQLCPLDHGYPRFAFTTFMDGAWEPFPDRTDTIPATQNGVGILSYLKYFELSGRQDRRFLRNAYAARGQVSRVHPIHRQARPISAAAGLRLARRSTV